METALPHTFDNEAHLRKARGFIHCAFAARDAGINEHELLGEVMTYTHGALHPMQIIFYIRMIRGIYAAIPRY